MSGKKIRLGRLFSRGNAVIVAADHGEFDGPISGMIDLPAALSNGLNLEVDGVLLSPGMVTHCAQIFARRGAPLAIMRLNWSSLYAFHWDYNQAATVPAIEVEDAIARGADIVLVALHLGTGSEEQDARSVEVFCRLANQAHRLGIPVIGEFFPAHYTKLTQEQMHDLVYSGARIAAELGADLIKTFYTHRFPAVVEACPIPVLALGSEKAPTQLQALQLAEQEVRDGARGVVFGRNALQVPDPKRFQAALCAVVREGLGAQEAVVRFGLPEGQDK